METENLLRDYQTFLNIPKTIKTIDSIKFNPKQRLINRTMNINLSVDYKSV